MHCRCFRALGMLWFAWVFFVLNSTPSLARQNMQGDFEGFANIVGISRDRVQGWVEKEFGNRIHLDERRFAEDASLYPVIILFGKQSSVSVQIFRRYIPLRDAPVYEEALLMIPFLYFANQKNTERYYMFSHIFVSDRGIVEKGIRLNNSPKYFSFFEHTVDTHRIISEQNNSLLEISRMQNFGGRQYTKVSQRQLAIFSTYFSQKKLEKEDRNQIGVFDFDFLKNAQILETRDWQVDQFMNLNFENLDFCDDIGSFYFKTHWQKTAIF